MTGLMDFQTKEVFDRILKIQDLGYTVVSSTIDPKDWSGKSAEEIFNETYANSKMVTLCFYMIQVESDCDD